MFECLNRTYVCTNTLILLEKIQKITCVELLFIPLLFFPKKGKYIEQKDIAYQAFFTKKKKQQQQQKSCY